MIEIVNIIYWINYFKRRIYLGIRIISANRQINRFRLSRNFGWLRRAKDAKTFNFRLKPFNIDCFNYPDLKVGVSQCTGYSGFSPKFESGLHDF